MTVVPLDDLGAYWPQARSSLRWNSPFVLPFWLQTVWRHLGGRGDPYLLRISDGLNLLGIVPLSVDNDTAYFLGKPDVCDYQDIIAAPGQGVRVMDAAMRHLALQGIRRMDLRSLRPDAVALQALQVLVSDKGIDVQLGDDEVAYDMVLPSRWDDYLMQLKRKQRHEVRRKIRRLQVNGPYAYRQAGVNGELERDTRIFLKLFQLNRKDKAAFMNRPMTRYFEDLIRNLAERGMLRLYLLWLDDAAAAAVLCFDFEGVRYLYNSGYDAQYVSLSVGILSKVFSIQTGIDAGCRRFDFLKGDEVYKKRIGGVRTPLFRCRIRIEG